MFYGSRQRTQPVSTLGAETNSIFQRPAPVQPTGVPRMGDPNQLTAPPRQAGQPASVFEQLHQMRYGTGTNTTDRLAAMLNPGTAVGGMPPPTRTGGVEPMPQTGSFGPLEPPGFGPPPGYNTGSNPGYHGPGVGIMGGPPVGPWANFDPNGITTGQERFQGMYPQPSVGGKGGTDRTGMPLTSLGLMNHFSQSMGARQPEAPQQPAYGGGGKGGGGSAYNRSQPSGMGSKGGYGR